MTISSYQIRMLIISIIITIIGYGVISIWAGFDTLVNSFNMLGLWAILFILALSFLNYTTRFLRWHYCMKIISEHKVPILRHFIIYLSGFALTTTPAKTGEVIRGIFLKKYGIDFKKTLACFFTERLSDLVTIIILCFFGLSYFHNYLIAIGIGTGLISVIFGFICYPQAIIMLRNFFKENTKLYRLFNHIYDILLLTHNHLKPVIFFKTLTMSIIAWSFEGYGFYYMIQLMGYDIDILQAIFIYAVSMLIGGISFVPAGLGTSEAVMIALLTANAIPLKIAVVMTVFIRLATLWFAIIIGFICLMIQSYSYTQKETSA
jgi:uncharacterized protein (TIRG00374 family)